MNATTTIPLASQARKGAFAAPLARVVSKVEAGERIDAEEALLLHDHADLGTLGRLADLVRWRKHPESIVTYIVDRNLNPTNVCITDCGFCAFYRRPKHDEAYVLEREVIYEKMQQLADLGGRQVLMQGGHHPYLKSDWYAELFSDPPRYRPVVSVHSPPRAHGWAGRNRVDRPMSFMADTWNRNHNEIFDQPEL